MFAAGSISDIKPEEYDFTTDFVIYSAVTAEKSIIDKATKDSYLTAGKWNLNGTITYIRNYFSTNEKKTLTYKYK